MKIFKYLVYILNLIFSLFLFILFFFSLIVSFFTLFDPSFLTKQVYPFFKIYKINLLPLEIFGEYLVKTGYWSILIDSIFFVLAFLYVSKSISNCFGIGKKISNLDEYEEDILSATKMRRREVNKLIKSARLRGDRLLLGFLYLLKNNKLKAFYYLKDLNLDDFKNSRDYTKVYDLYFGYILPFLKEWRRKSFLRKLFWKIFHASQPNPDKFNDIGLMEKIYKNTFEFYLKNRSYSKAFETLKDFPLDLVGEKGVSFKTSLANTFERTVIEEIERIKVERTPSKSFFGSVSREGVKLTSPDLYGLLEELYDILGEEKKKVEVLLKQRKNREAADILLNLGNYKKSAEIFLSLGNYKKALEVIDRVEDEKKNPEELLLKLNILMEYGFSKRAIKFLKDYEKKLYETDNFDILMETGKVCFKLKLGDISIKFLKRAEIIDSIAFSKKGGPLLLDELLSEKSSYEKMEKDLEIYSETNPKLMVEDIFNSQKRNDDEVIDLFDSSYVISGRYELIEELGRGGAGVVYLSKDKILDRDVAVKELKKISGIKDEEKIKEFFKEARLLAKLNHQNIVQLYDILKEDSKDGEMRYFIIMEYVEGSSLEDMIKEISPMKLKFAIPIILQVLDGLYFAHKKDIIHLDIKPANILVTYDENIPKITDFGIAKAMFSLFNPDDKFRGTPKYVSPEVILGKSVDVRADIYSLGVTFFEMLTGEIPYSKNVKSVKEFVENKVKSEPFKLSNFLLGVDSELERIVSKSIAHNPDERYSSALEMKKEIEKYYLENIKFKEEE